jgi:ABC-2 type transport system permease protein
MAPTESGVIDTSTVSLATATEAPVDEKSVDAARPRESLRRYVDMTRELALTQFKLKYTGSALGYAWSLMKPAMVFGVMYLVFGYVFHAGNQSPNFVMQLLLGVVLWTFFADAVGASVGSVASNGQLVRKAYFPRVILVIASTLTALLTFLINLGLVVLIAAPLNQLTLGPQTLVVPFLLIELYVLVFGISLLLASLFVFYRDLGYVWEVSSQVLFYGSAVVYPLALLTGRYAPKLVMSNPVAQIIEDTRHALISDSPKVPWASQVLGVPLALVPFAITAALLILGALTFRVLTPRFAESL